MLWTGSRGAHRGASEWFGMVKKWEVRSFLLRKEF